MGILEDGLTSEKLDLMLKRAFAIVEQEKLTADNEVMDVDGYKLTKADIAFIVDRALADGDEEAQAMAKKLMELQGK